MLDVSEIEERAKYCYCAFLQLSWLYSNDFAEPPRYLDYLAKSSLGLGSDQFIVMTLEEAMMENQPQPVLRSLISLYEGFTHAFCQVLEREMDEIRALISPDFLKVLEEEMGVGCEFTRSAAQDPEGRLTRSTTRTIR